MDAVVCARTGVIFIHGPRTSWTPGIVECRPDVRHPKTTSEVPESWLSTIAQAERMREAVVMP